MKLLDKILGAMKDNRGMFQGGEYGRVGGRVLDAIDANQYGMQQPIGEMPDYDNMPKANPGKRILEQEYMKTPRNEPMSGKLSPVGNRIDYMLQNFDPTSNDSVLELQKMLNSSGALGTKLSEDGMFGKKTLAAVRQLQAARDKVLNPNPAPAPAPKRNEYKVKRKNRKWDWRNEPLVKKGRSGTNYIAMPMGDYTIEQ